MTHPWDKRPGETAKAYRAFTCYLELGPKRSLVAAAEAYAVPKKRQKSARKAPRNSAPGHITRWANQHDWTTRAEAFDQHQLEQRIAARAEVRERAREKLFQLSDGLVERLVDLTGIDRPAYMCRRSKRDGSMLGGYPEGRVRHCRKPDGDNVAKSVLDALSDWWVDDAQVSVLRVEKWYRAMDERPKLEIHVGAPVEVKA